MEPLSTLILPFLLLVEGFDFTLKKLSFISTFGGVVSVCSKIEYAVLNELFLGDNELERLFLLVPEIVASVMLSSFLFR